MPRKVNVASRTSRNHDAPIGPKLHIEKVQGMRGLAIGYRRGANGGKFHVRRHLGNSVYEFAPLGAADDSLPADGVTVLSFEQAVKEARQWLQKRMLEESGQVLPGSYSVSQCLDDYLAALKVRKDGDHAQTTSTIEAKIKPALGEKSLAHLTQKHIEDWFHGLVAKGNSKATANRNLTVLCAALNHAYRKNRIATKAVWDKIAKFKGATNARARFLTLDECKRLIAACPHDFQLLVRAALYTGARYGEIIAFRVEDYNASNQSIHIPKSKSGKPRTIALTRKGAAFFKAIIAGKDANELMFTHTSGRHKGEPWQRTQQTFHMKVGCKAAKIKPHCGFHVLRHSYASHLKMKGADSFIVAKQLGHRDTRMVELHYQHLEDGHIAQEVRDRLPDLGFVGARKLNDSPTPSKAATNDRKGGLRLVASGSRS